MRNGAASAGEITADTAHEWRNGSSCLLCCNMISMYSSTSSDGGVVSTSRIINVTLIVLLVFIIIFNYVCLSVVVAKNYEMVDKFDPQHEVTEDDDDVCIFFINDDHPVGDTGACDVVIYGSGVVIITALLMMAFLVIRTILYKK